MPRRLARAPARRHQAASATSGTAASSSRVYSWAGSEKIRSVGPRSTTTPAVHHGDLVGDGSGGGEVVGDEEQGDAELGPQVAEQVEDLGGERDVERGDRLVAGEQGRGDGDRPGDRRALALAAGQLARKGGGRLGGEADRLERRARPARPARPGARRARRAARRSGRRSTSTGSATRRRPGRSAGARHPARGGRCRCVGSSRPTTIRSSVVLPEPDSPTIAREPPAGSGQADAVDGAQRLQAGRRTDAGGGGAYSRTTSSRTSAGGGSSGRARRGSRRA